MSERLPQEENMADSRLRQLAQIALARAKKTGRSSFDFDGTRVEVVAPITNADPGDETDYRDAG